jgi:hypothetical protein
MQIIVKRKVVLSPPGLILYEGKPQERTNVGSRNSPRRVSARVTVQDQGGTR